MRARARAQAKPTSTLDSLAPLGRIPDKEEQILAGAFEVV